MTEVRKGQAPANIERAEFHERFMQSFQDPAFRAEAEALAQLEVIAWEAYQEGRKAPSRARPAPATPTPTTTLSVDWLEAKDAHRARAGRVGQAGDAVARAAGQRLAAQRRHLPRRDLQDLPARAARARSARAARHRGRRARPEPAHLRLRPPHPSVQGLRLDRHAAVPLALQLLPQPFAAPDRRLDERDLRALGRGARRHPAARRCTGTRRPARSS